MMATNAFIWLQNWYTSQCNGDWEHTYGIDIKTLDNPGWLVVIDLVETEFENCKFDEVSIKRSDNDWIDCFVNDGKFQGAGGSFNLLEILNIFKDWVEAKDYK
ncbi:MAG: immunity 53 family protein [Crocosphaera sp.]|nr:immunity 53 family protein [Crocosphaera sp.]